MRRATHCRKCGVELTPQNRCRQWGRARCASCFDLENRARAKAWRDADPKRAYASQCASRAKLRARGKRLSARTLSELRDAHATRVAQRRARVRAAAGRGVAHAEWIALCRRFQGRCAYCGRRETLTRDHVVPLGEGPHDISNIVPACKTCNSRKGVKRWRPFHPDAGEQY